jgi:hypothetical protein
MTQKPGLARGETNLYMKVALGDYVGMWIHT